MIGNAAIDERFAGDGYIARVNARSILCVPVGHQGRLGGILYLENNLTTDAFTPDRIEMMRILAAQTAISLENARLYEEHEERGQTADCGRTRAARRAVRGGGAEEPPRGRERVSAGGDPDAAQLQRDRRQQPAAARSAAKGRAGGADRLDRAIIGETGIRQGTVRAGGPQPQPAERPAARQGELRRDRARAWSKASCSAT